MPIHERPFRAASSDTGTAVPTVTAAMPALSLLPSLRSRRDGGSAQDDGGAPAAAEAPRRPLLTSALASRAAVSSWRRSEECRDAGRSDEGELFWEQACWRARLAARLRVEECAVLSGGRPA